MSVLFYVATWWVREFSMSRINGVIAGGRLKEQLKAAAQETPHPLKIIVFNTIPNDPFPIRAASLQSREIAAIFIYSDPPANNQGNQRYPFISSTPPPIPPTTHHQAETEAEKRKIGRKFQGFSDRKIGTRTRVWVFLFRFSHFCLHPCLFID